MSLIILPLSKSPGALLSAVILQDTKRGHASWSLSSIAVAPSSVIPLSIFSADASTRAERFARAAFALS